MEFAIMGIILVGMVLFMSQSNKKARARAEEHRNSILVVGTDVMTTAGFYGRIVAIDGDAVTLESPSGDETVWSRLAIREQASIPFAPVSEEEAAAEDVAEAARLSASEESGAGAVADNAAGTGAPTGAATPEVTGHVTPRSTDSAFGEKKDESGSAWK
ncbi:MULTISPECIES: preprotein translocase subunit YajC [Actinotignum]|uniref:Preprotein translocase subunit YajC n=1 Tax=Actinotignum timonense TaxID=1870995 RepID=A0AAW9HLM6_9ACTO|nr:MULTISPECIES: preprotein translocase subunit YajC [Actinotignum]MBS5748024.1 preprotein translocase subunit YajC [Actinotignum schaalii]MDE1535562.1 preprotein translocase subunit YajC [Actinotignum schaalii]MDE1558076.1 preprotein translocase subunit YajC [Actinotignum schaalii]MDE1662466.1 preprotein translocase subunit YajC [Actinotignum schaalii]MDK6373060.1 preprotein translocase subunit YajC [Actinotignum timonense]